MKKIIEVIPFGHKNAVTRKYLSMITGYSDRKIREMIERECTRAHPILNMQDGKGYFQPDENEIYLVRLYRAQENRRMVHNRKKVTELDKYIAESGNELKKNQISMFDIIGGE